MDGTLYDSMGNHADAWVMMSREAGIPVDRDEFFMYEGRTGASTINILFNRHHHRDATPEECAALYKRKTEIFQTLPPVQPMPGALRLMEFLKASGLTIVLVTGSGQNSLLSRIDSDYPGIFSEGLRITSRDVEHGKPHPEPYLKAMALAGVSAAESIAIENAPLGVESAHRSGAFTVGVTTGPIPAESLRASGADIVYGSMEECANSFPELYNKLTNPQQQS